MREIREMLVRKLAGDMRIPAMSTVHAVLDRHGLVPHARKRHKASVTYLFGVDNNGNGEPRRI